MDVICIRFHYGGWFEQLGCHLHYLGGGIAEAWIDVDKLSYFEIKGHLEDYYRSHNVVRLFWLKPKMEMTNGLVLLSDDAGCKVMLEAHSPDQYYPEGLVVDMYTENVGTDLLEDVEPVEVLPPEPEGDSSEEQSEGDPESEG